MRSRFERTLPYFITIIVLFFALPIALLLIASRTDVESVNPIIAVLYNGIPLIDLCCSMVVGFFFGKNCGGDWLIGIEAGVSFVPCVYIFFNATAMLYIVFIAIAALLGAVLGKVFGDRFGRNAR